MVKRIALEDSSIEEMEREIQSDLEDRGLNNSQTNFGRQSQNSELLRSVKSSQDYWAIIENKITRRQNRERSKKAAFLDKTGDDPKQHKVQRQNVQRFDDLGKKLDAMKKAHEVELRTIRKASRKA